MSYAQLTCIYKLWVEYPKNMSGIFQNYELNIPKSCVEYSKIRSEISKNYEGNIQKLWVKYPKIMSGISQNYDWNIKKLGVGNPKVIVRISTAFYMIYDSSVCRSVRQRHSSNTSFSIWILGWKYFNALTSFPKDKLHQWLDFTVSTSFQRSFTGTGVFASARSGYIG